LICPGQGRKQNMWSVDLPGACHWTGVLRRRCTA
jgi:hypothetical protein